MSTNARTAGNIDAAVAAATAAATANPTAIASLVGKLSDEQVHDIRRWFANFERAADVVRWSPEHRLQVLPLFLAGEAANIFHQLAPGDQATFATVKDKLINAFAGSTDTIWLRQQLAQRRLQAGESVRAYARAIQVLCGRINSSMEDGEKVAAFLAGLPHEWRTLLAVLETSSDKPLTFDDIVSRACKIGEMQGQGHGGQVTPAVPRITAAPILAAMAPTLDPAAAFEQDRHGAAIKRIEEEVRRLSDVVALHVASAPPRSQGPTGNPRHHDRPRQDRRDADSASDRDPASNSAVQCAYCGKPRHYAVDCRTRIRDLATFQGRSSSHPYQRPPGHGRHGGYAPTSDKDNSGPADKDSVSGRPKNL